MNLHTPMATKVVGGLALALVAALGWLLALGPQTSALAEVRAQVQDTRDQNLLLSQQLRSLQQQAEHLDDTRAEAGALAAMFPPTADQPGLFQAVTKAAADAGIGAKHVTALTPTAPSIGGADATGAVQLATPTSGLARQTVTISVQGSYAQTQLLMENLEAMKRAYLVSAVTVGGGAQTGAYVTTITGDMFVMAPATDPGDVLADPAAAAGAATGVQ